LANLLELCNANKKMKLMIDNVNDSTGIYLINEKSKGSVGAGKQLAIDSKI
jgi:hypothetical protein